MNIYKRTVYLYTALNGFYWMAYCLAYSYAAVYMEDVGFSAEKIGLTLAIGSAISVIIQQMSANAVDKGKLPLRYGIVGSAALIVAVSFSISHFIGVTFISALLIISLTMSMQSLINTLGINYINDGMPLNYGNARGIGSFLYAVVSISAGTLLSKYGTAVLQTGLQILMCGLIAVTLVLPKSPKTERPEITESLLGIFKKYKGFGFIFAGLTAVFMSHMVINNFMIKIVQGVGKGSGEMGIAFAISATLELPMMSWYGKKVRSRHAAYMMFSSVFFAVKAIILYFASSIYIVYISQCLQIVTFALLSPSSIYFVAEFMEKNDRAKGQALMTAVISIGSIMGSYIGGKMISMHGVRALLIMDTAIAVVGAVLLRVGVVRSKALSS